jgi:hypothetical protein
MVGWIAAVMLAGRPAPRKAAAVTLTVPAPVPGLVEQPSVHPAPLVRAYGADVRSGQRAA